MEAGVERVEGSSESLARVLVAEDGRAFREALIRILSAAGYEVEAAADGAAALARLQEGRPYDLAIVDILMPDLSGVEVVDQMRSVLVDPPPVIYMSGEVSPALNDEPDQIDGDPILAKPFEPEALLEAVGRVLA